MSALRFNVAGLLKETSGAARDLEVNAPPAELTGLLESGRPAASLKGRLRALRTPRSVFVRGQLQTRVALECSRCLEEAEVPIRFALEAEYYPQIDVTTGKSVTIPDDDLGFSIDPNHELDLAEPVRQHLLLELPMSVTCRDECKGLCPSCGADLNARPCGCSDEVVDERMAPLRDLLAKTKLSS